MNTDNLLKIKNDMYAVLDMVYERSKGVAEIPRDMLEVWARTVREFLSKPYKTGDYCEISHNECLNHLGACVGCDIFRNKDCNKKIETYLIEIGTTTRRGSFNRLFQKAITISDPQVRTYDVRNYFENKYDGLTVKVTQVQALDISEKIKETLKSDDDYKDSPEIESYIRDFTIQYTDSEKELHREYQKASCRAEDTLRELHKSIRRRYSKLFYSGFSSDFSPNKMELHTSYNDTQCSKYPVRADLFIEAAKKAEEPTFDEIDMPSILDIKTVNPGEIPDTSIQQQFNEALAGQNTFPGITDDDKSPDIPF